MIACLKLGGGLLLLIAANVALGSVGAVLSKEWNAKIFLGGLFKAGVVIFSFGAVCLAGWLNPDLVVFEIEGNSVNLQTAVYLVILAGFVYYGTAVLGKLKKIITDHAAQK